MRTEGETTGGADATAEGPESPTADQLSLAELMALLAAAAMVASYARHFFIAVNAGYPITLIYPAPWDFVGGLFQCLPFLLTLPYYIVKIGRSFKEWRFSIRKSNVLWSIAPALAIASFVGTCALYMSVIICLLLKGDTMPLPARLCLGALLFMWLFVLFIARWVPGTCVVSTTVRLFLYEAGATSMLYAIPLSLFAIESRGVHGLTASFIVFVVAVVIMAIQICCASWDEDGRSLIAGSIDKARMVLCARGGLTRLLAVVAISAVVGFVSGFPSPLYEPVAIDADGVRYKVLDVFDGSRAVLTKEDPARATGGDGCVEYHLVNLDDGYVIVD